MTATSAKLGYDTVVVHNMSDLVFFGINPLTGEACAFSQRVLCDVNEEGFALLSDYFGMPEMKLADRMNSQVNGKPSVGSVMLDRAITRPLAKFAAFHINALAYHESADGSVVVISGEDRLEQYKKACMTLVMNPVHRSNHPRVGSRNVHEFTGRAV